MTSNLVTKVIPITRMDCPTCIPVLEREVTRLEGVAEVQGNYINKTLKVTYDSSRVKLTHIEAAIERIGYRITYKKYPGVISRVKKFLQGEKEQVEAIPSLTDTLFAAKVLQASGPIVIIFSFATCPPCQVFKRQFKEIAQQIADKARFYEMDITSTQTWRRYDILSVPSVLIFRNGQLSERFDALPKITDITQALIIEDS